MPIRRAVYKVPITVSLLSPTARRAWFGELQRGKDWMRKVEKLVREGVGFRDRGQHHGKAFLSFVRPLRGFP